MYKLIGFLSLISLVACSKESEFNAKVGSRQVAAGAANVEVQAPVPEPVIPAGPVPPAAVIPPVIISDDQAPASETIDFPGTKVSRVGINFEDHQLNDDYNDAVLCFTGQFDITTDGKVRSVIKQDVEIDRFNGSGTYHDLIIKLARIDGTLHSETIPAFGVTNREAPAIRIMSFEKGDYLDVTMINHDSPADESKWKSMNSEWAKVLLDQCNNSGG